MLVIATAALGLSAPTASADTMYGGAGLYKGKQPGPSISLLRRDDGTVLARVVLAVDCKRTANYSKAIRLAGSTPNGVNFTASGHSRFGRVGTVRVSVSGTLAADSATGTLTWRTPCRRFTRSMVLKTGSAPAGAAAKPAPNSVLHGLTSQSSSGLRLAVSLRVAGNGRVWALWQASVRCPGAGSVPVLDGTPTRTVKADGTFGGSQRYRIAFKGVTEIYRVSFRGRFLADGATGTLSARLQYRSGKRRSAMCRSGTQTWTART